MWSAVFGGSFVAIVVIGAAIVALILWAITDAASRPRKSFEVTGLSKTKWLILLVVFTSVTGFVGLGLSINYLFIARPKMRAAASSTEPRQWRFAMGVVIPLVMVWFTLTYGVELASSPPTTTRPLAALAGYLHGRCRSAGAPTDGYRVTVRLSSKPSGRVLQTSTLGDDTGRSAFTFYVTPGEYVVTAAPGGTTSHWGLTFGANGSPAPQTLPVPVIMNIPIAVVCGSSPSR